MFVHHGRGWGGAPLSLLYTAKALDRKRFDPRVLFIHRGKIIELYDKQGIKTYVDEKILDLGHTEVSSYLIISPMFWFRLFYQPLSAFFFYLFLKKTKPDLIHLNTSSLIACAIAAKLRGIPVVFHVREPLARGWFGVRQWFMKHLVNKFSDAIIAISEYDASRLVPSKKIKVVYNFVDFKTFDKSLKGDYYARKFGLKGKKIILMLGGISKLKGTHVLIEALKRVKEKIPQVKCVIAGPSKGFLGFYAWSVKRFVRQNGLQENVVFAGTVKDVPRLIAASDVVVFPSTRPHFARPVVEASAMAKPAVASKLGGCLEIIVNGKTGLLVKPGDLRALAEALIKILGNPASAAKMSSKGYGFAKKNFDAEKNVRQIMQVYDSLLSK